MSSSLQSWRLCVCNKTYLHDISYDAITPGVAVAAIRLMDVQFLTSIVLRDDLVLLRKASVTSFLPTNRNERPRRVFCCLDTAMMLTDCDPGTCNLLMNVQAKYDHEPGNNVSAELSLAGPVAMAFIRHYLHGRLSSHTIVCTSRDNAIL